MINSGRTARIDPCFVAAAALLVVAMVLGGGGSPYAMPETIVLLVGVAGLATALLAGRTRGLFGAGTAVPLGVLGGAGLLIAAQLVPLPPAIWSALPGREVLWLTARATGMAEVARPISADWEATARTALALIPAAAMFMLAAVLAPHQLRRLAALFVIGAAAHLLVGLLQVAGGGVDFYPYLGSHRGVAVGLFANRNHFATAMLLAILLAAAVLRPPPGSRPGLRTPLLLVGVVAFAVGVIAASSRASAAMLILALIPVPFLFGWTPGRGRAVVTFAASCVGVLAVAGAMWSAGRGSWAGTLGGRFAELGGDDRYGIWQDTLYAATLYFPTGSGLGTFDPMFRSIERLSEVGSHYSNHAHNDYLELAMETGLVGTVLAAILVGWIAVRSARVWRPRMAGELTPLSRAASVGLLIVLLHSAVDYPLRTLALGTVFGLLAGMLVRRAPGRAIR